MSYVLFYSLFFNFHLNLVIYPNDCTQIHFGLANANALAQFPKHAAISTLTNENGNQHES